VPAIAGQHFEVVLGQLADMRDDERHNPRMKPFLDDAELPGAQALADVSAHISSLLPNPEPQSGPGGDLELGEGLYHRLCGHCHGIGGEGDSELQIPRVQGQHYAYLVGQIEAFRTGARHTLDPGTSDLLRDLSRREIEAVADYMSRLVPTRMPSRPPVRDARLQGSAASGELRRRASIELTSTPPPDMQDLPYRVELGRAAGPRLGMAGPSMPVLPELLPGR
jgi:cytochrome c553